MHELLGRLLIRFEADVFVVAAVRRQIVLINLALARLLAQVVDFFFASLLPRQKVLAIRQRSLHHFGLTLILLAHGQLLFLRTIV